MEDWPNRKTLDTSLGPDDSASTVLGSACQTQATEFFNSNSFSEPSYVHVAWFCILVANQARRTRYANFSTVCCKSISLAIIQSLQQRCAKHLVVADLSMIIAWRRAIDQNGLPSPILRMIPSFRIWVSAPEYLIHGPGQIQTASRTVLDNWVDPTNGTAENLLVAPFGISCPWNRSDTDWSLYGA